MNLEQLIGSNRYLAQLPTTLRLKAANELRRFSDKSTMSELSTEYPSCSKFVEMVVAPRSHDPSFWLSAATAHESGLLDEMTKLETRLIDCKNKVASLMQEGMKED